MAWLSLIGAGLLEVVWAIALKKSHGFTVPLATGVFVVGLIASMALLATALRTLPVGTGYAIWTGIGAVGTAILGLVLFHEEASPLRLASIACIAVGIAGLGLASQN